MPSPFCITDIRFDHASFCNNIIYHILSVCNKKAAKIRHFFVCFDENAYIFSYASTL